MSKVEESYFENLEKITKSLEKERLFVNGLRRAKMSFIAANKVLVLIGFFPDFSLGILSYLKEKNGELFKYQPSKTTIVLIDLLIEILSNARLSVYLALRGVFPQALSVLRKCIELVGIFTHIWNEPQKIQHVWNSDSDEHAKAFRYTKDKEINNKLKKAKATYRFMYCYYSKTFTELYKHLSGKYVHNTKSDMGIQAEKQKRYSCFLVDRFHPKDIAKQYEILQFTLATIMLEIYNCIPEEDRTHKTIAELTIFLGTFGPVATNISSPS